ncbi:MAG: type II toxin-antitoxin system VapC family toxin [Devosia sp.]
MRLLLDTCAAIWITEGERISPAAKLEIDRSAVEGRPVYLGICTAWERAMLSSKHKLTSPLSPKAWFDRLASRPEIEVVPLTSDILIDSCFLPGPVHGDPADRILIATARALDLTLVTRDSAILDYSARGHVRALPC